MGRQSKKEVKEKKGCKKGGGVEVGMGIINQDHE